MPGIAPRQTTTTSDLDICQRRLIDARPDETQKTPDTPSPQLIACKPLGDANPVHPSKEVPMSQVTARNASQLLAVPTAIGPVVFLPVVPTAQAEPLIPPRACEKYVFNGEFRAR